MYSLLSSALAVQLLTGAASDVVGVGGASAVILGYVDSPIELDGTAVPNAVSG